MSENTPEEQPEEYQGKHEAPLAPASPEPNGYLSNQNYELFKKFSLFVLPALAAAYFGLAQIWGLPKAEEVVGSVAVIETLLGIVLGISNSRFEASGDKYDGQVVFEPDHENGLTNMNFKLTPEKVEAKAHSGKPLVLKVKNEL